MGLLSFCWRLREEPCQAEGLLLGFRKMSFGGRGEAPPHAHTHTRARAHTHAHTHTSCVAPTNTVLPFKSVSCSCRKEKQKPRMRMNYISSFPPVPFIKEKNDHSRVEEETPFWTIFSRFLS